MKATKKLKILFSIMQKASKSYVWMILFGSLFSSIRILLNVILPKYLIEELLGNQDINRLILMFCLIVGSNLLFNFLDRIYKRILDEKNAYIERRIHEIMAEKIMAVDYQYLEDPYYLDLKERALFACTNQSALVNIINAFSKTVSNIFTLIGLVVIMFTLSYVLVLVLFIGIICVMLIDHLFKKYQVRFFENLLPINRKYGYYLQQTFNFSLSKEMRLDQMSPIFLDKVKRFNKQINDEFGAFFKKAGLVTGIFKFINYIQIGLVYLYVGFRVFSASWGAKISIGDFTMYTTSALSFSQAFSDLADNLMVIGQMLSYLTPLVEFMELPEASTHATNKKVGVIETIEFRDLSFKYPKSEVFVLSSINAVIHRGEKISIVGLNGAGKTTLIKLLCRFYTPTSGAILINGCPIEEYDYLDYLTHISAVFQDYRLFAYSLADNIAGDKQIDSDRLKEVIHEVGLEEKVASLPQQLDSVLNKAYDPDGLELSGGQQQKLAIARALYKNSDLVILDEPTSALDPLAEAEIYQQFNELVTHKTAVYISHRMSSSVFCDKILIIDGGKVADYAPHKELMKKKDSLYYRLFTSQAKNYRLQAKSKDYPESFA